MNNKEFTLEEIKAVANKRFRIRQYYSIWYRMLCTSLIFISIIFLLTSLSIVSSESVVWNTQSYVSISLFVIMFLVTVLNMR